MARVRFIVYEPPEKGLPFLAVTMIDSNFNAAVPAKTLKEAEAVFAKAEEAANHLRAAHNLHLERTGNSFGVLRNSWACERLRPGLRKNRSPSRKSKFSSPKSHGYSTNPFTTKNHTSKHQPKKIGLDMMRSFLRAAAVWLSLIAPAWSAGTIPIALQQSVDANGSPLSGCLLYIFQVGTTAAPQNAFTDFGLTGELREGVPGGRVRQDPRRRHGRSALEKVANGVWWPDRDRLEADLAAFESVTSTTIARSAEQ